MDIELERLLNMKYSDEILSRKLRGIKHLRSKLDYSKELILGAYIDLKILIENHARRKMDLQHKIELAHKDKNEEHTAIYRYKEFVAEDPVFFNLETFLMDLKRCIEFAIKFMAEKKKFKVKDFSLSKLISVLFQEKIEGNNILKFLESNNIRYLNYLRSIAEWLKSMNEKRNMIIHVEVLNRTSTFDVNLKWEVGRSFIDRPKIIVPEIPIDGESILSFVDNQIKKLDGFLKETLSA